MGKKQKAPKSFFIYDAEYRKVNWEPHGHFVRIDDDPLPRYAYDSDGVDVTLRFKDGKHTYRVTVEEVE